jgi:hypothetical protein
MVVSIRAYASSSRPRSARTKEASPPLPRRDRGEGLAPFAVAAGDHHYRALGDEQASDLLAQTRRRPGDDGDVAGQASPIVGRVSSAWRVRAS